MKRFLISILVFASAFMQCQVGINTDSPSQMLHVAGKIQLEDDDAPATPGAMRYRDGKLQVFTQNWETVQTSLLTESQMNLSYGTHPQQQFDFYKGLQNEKVVVFLHGGGWNALHRQRDYYRSFVLDMVRENPTANFLNVDYRLASQGGDEYVFPDMIDDLNTVISLVKKDFPAAQITVVGNSAGGHLALWQYWNYDTVEAVVAICTPYDGTIDHMHGMNYFEYSIAPWLQAQFIHPSLGVTDPIAYASPRSWHLPAKNNILWLYMTGDPMHQHEAFLYDFPTVEAHLLNTSHSGWLAGGHRRNTLNHIKNFLTN